MKTIILFCITAFTLILFTSQTQAPKPLTVTLTIDQWNYTLDAIDKSNAPHANVKQILEWITPQLQKQLADTTKKK